ncbi:LysR family transcriptional regulator [Actinoplanes sp. TBRC 11911]|uniref:LysR family transcriptional regulator n=1 Tax=Actinoplanes sp. TBRC 11911 TaxID=2729386 RepID=UPI00145EA648|nr:LysR family transcriptional regulator [Actinoplanes sp. TBRC 11911]NMO55518.1 LysR family transcriptional regulator [Actinoplanes sp. TBRC 11911]
MATLRALECLVSIVDLGSVTRAAAALRISQPALSHQILSLEKELGTQVVERLPRGVRPTPAGRAAAQEARSALHHAALAVTIGRKVGRGEAGLLRIATAETMTPWLLTRAIREWRLRHPEVDFELSEFTSADRMDEFLSAGHADLIVGPRPTETSHHVELLGREEMVVVASGTHPFAGLPSVAVAALAGEPFIHYVPENGLSIWVDTLMAEHHVTLNTILRTRSPRTAAGLAAADIGVTIVPVSALSTRTEGTVRPLRPQILRDVIATIAAPADELSRRFVDDLAKRGLPDDGRAVFA